LIGDESSRPGEIADRRLRLRSGAKAPSKAGPNEGSSRRKEAGALHAKQIEAQWGQSNGIASAAGRGVGLLLAAVAKLRSRAPDGEAGLPH